MNKPHSVTLVQKKANLQPQLESLKPIPAPYVIHLSFPDPSVSHFPFPGSPVGKETSRVVHTLYFIWNFCPLDEKEGASSLRY